MLHVARQGTIFNWQSINAREMRRLMSVLYTLYSCLHEDWRLTP